MATRRVSPSTAASNAARPLTIDMGSRGLVLRLDDDHPENAADHAHALLQSAAHCARALWKDQEYREQLAEGLPLVILGIELGLAYSQIASEGGAQA